MLSKLKEYIKAIGTFLSENIILLYILLGFFIFFLLILSFVGFFSSVHFLFSSNDCCEYKSLIRLLLFTYVALFFNILLFFKVSLELVITFGTVAVVFSISYITVNFLLCFIKCYNESFGLWIILLSHTMILGLFILGIVMYLFYNITYVIYQKHYSSLLNEFEQNFSTAPTPTTSQTNVTNTHFKEN